MSLGKGKDFVYSENSCYEKSSTESLTAENKLSNKSEKSINDASLGPLWEIKNLRLKNINKAIISNTKTDSLPNKFEQLKEASQFLVKGFAEPFWLDLNINGGRVMIYIGDDIPSRLLSKHAFPSDIKGLHIERNFRKCQWLVQGTYHLPSQSDHYYFNNLGNSLYTYTNYEKKLLIWLQCTIIIGAHSFINMVLVKESMCFKICFKS